MCSIAGLVWDAPTSTDRTLEVVRTMNTALRHRGPDGAGVAVVGDRRLTIRRWTGTGELAAPPSSIAQRSEGSVGLGMNRLAIRDVEAGHQPMVDASGTCTIVFNGEIYNTEEIEPDLRAAGVVLKTRSDTEVILEAYRLWGPACVERLVGMFAFAIWDDREESLFIARDRLGIKPLVWARARGAFLFGSELKALLRTNLVARKVRHKAINRFLYHLYVPPPEGPLEDVHVLEPAHTLTLRGGDISIRRYWSASYATGPRRSTDQHAEHFRSLMERAVRSHLVSDVPVGAFLSGGLDSSTVVTLMKRFATSSVHTYTVGFDVAAYDESRDAAASAEFMGTQHTEIQVALKDIEDVILPVLTHYDQPFADASAVPTYVLCRETARHVKVALAGDGSDEQLAGYPRVRHYGLLEAMRRAPRPLRDAIGRGIEGVAPLLGQRARGARNFAEYAAVLHAGGANDPMSGYIHLRHVFRNGWHERLLSTAFAESVVADDPSFHIHAAAEASRAGDPLTRMLDVEVQTYLPNDILQKVDIASGAHGLEVRVPFLDHRLVEAVAAMPLHMKLRPRESKVALRRSMGRDLPPHTLTKRKRGFHLPVAEWFRERGKPLLHDVLLSKRAFERGYFVPSVLTAIVAEHVSGTANHGNMLFALLQLELWHRTWVDAPSA